MFDLNVSTAAPTCCESGSKNVRRKCFGGLKVQSCKLYNDKYMIASTHLTNTEVFAFIAVLVSKLLNRKVLFIKGKDNRNC